jgi:hypothetical protein
MAGFLGIQIERDKQDGKLTLTQTGLIDRILSATCLHDSNAKFTPAEKVPLSNDIEGEDCCEAWNYQSIVGMLLYLAGSTRPDIAYAVQHVSLMHQSGHTKWESNILLDISKELGTKA